MHAAPHHIITTILQTNIPVQHNELEAVKKALGTWLKMKGFAQHSWVHNHESEEDPKFTRQSYPLVQLRCPNGQLQLWGMQQGAEILQQIMLTEMLRGFQYQGTQCRILPQHTKTSIHPLAFITSKEKKQLYELNYFVALSAPNFKSWQELPSAAQRMERLQQLLVNNIAMFCKAAGFTVDKQMLQVSIYWLWHSRWVYIKEHKVLAFTLSYTSNLQLPDGISLGRQTRLGYGWQTLRNSEEVVL